MVYFSYVTPYGYITIQSNGQAICALTFGARVLEGEYRPDQFTNKAATQIQEYFAHKRSQFDLPLYLKGSNFQKEVWTATLDVPYGTTCTYAQLAKRMGKPNAAQAIGNALNKNPLLILVPCHRIVGAHGVLGGFAAGAKAKEFLLKFEGTTLT